MEALVRKILNYDAQRATKEQSEELCAAVSAISMYLLDKTGQFNLPDDLDIIYSSDVKGGVSGKGVIRLHTEFFRNRDNFLNDISIIAHENAHNAQRHFKDEARIIRNEDALVCQSSHFYILEYFTALISFPQFGGIVQNYGLGAATKFSEELNKLHFYFKSFYDLQSFETEANNFSIEVIKYIIKTGHALNLTPVEKRNLKALEDESKNVEGFYDTQNYMRKLRQDRAYAEEVKNYITNVRQYFYENEPELIDTIKNEKSIDVETNGWYANIVSVLCLSLEVDYDEELARKLYNSMLKSKQSRERDFCLLELALWTQLDLSDQELTELDDIYNHSSHKVETATLASLLKDKKRVQAEREAINSNTKLDICEFNF